MMFPIVYNQQPLYYAQRPYDVYSPYVQRPSYSEQRFYNEPLTYKFNEVDDTCDEMLIGKQASAHLYNEFMEEYLQEIILQRKNSFRFNQHYGHPLFDSFFNGLDPYQSASELLTKDDIKKANEAFSRNIFKNYKFSISKNSKELSIMNANNKIVKIFELPNSYDNISIESLTTLETGLAVIRLNLKKSSVIENPVKKVQKKTSRSFENKNVLALKEAYENQLKEQEKLKVKQQEEEIKQNKREKELALKAAEEMANKKRELKAQKEEEQKKLKAKQLEQAKKDYEIKKMKLKEQKERMERQAEKLKQKEKALQELYDKELEKLELEAQLASEPTVYSPIPNEENESDEDVHMNEESQCSDDSDSLESKINKTTEIPLKKKTSITVEDIEDESDKEYRISLMKFPNTNAVLEEV